MFDSFWALTYISSHTHPRVVNFTLFSREVYVLVLYYLLYRSVNLNWFCFSAQNKQWIYSTVATRKRTTTVYCAKVIEMFFKSLKSTLRSVWQYWQFWFLKDFNGFSFSTSYVFNAVWFVFMFMLLYLFVSFFFFLTLYSFVHGFQGWGHVRSILASTKFGCFYLVRDAVVPKYHRVQLTLCREFDWQVIWPIITPSQPFLSDKQTRQKSRLTSVDFKWCVLTSFTQYFRKIAYLLMFIHVYFML